MFRKNLRSLFSYTTALTCGLLVHCPAIAGVEAPTAEFVECWDEFGGWMAFRTYGQSVFFDHQMTPPNDDYYENNEAPVLTPPAVAGTPGHMGPYDGIPAGTPEVRIQTHVGVPSGNVPYNIILSPEFAFVQSGDHDLRPSGLISCEEGFFYMFRWSLHNSRTQAQVLGEVNDIRCRVGSPDSRGIGTFVDEVMLGTNNIAGDRSFRSYLYAPVSGLSMAALDVVDVGTDDVGTDVRLSKVDVFKFSRADLEALGGTVVFNQGAASFPTADGTVPPSTGLAGFDLVNTWTTEALNAHGAAANVRPFSTTGSSLQQLVLNMSATNAPANNFGLWDTTRDRSTDFVNEISVSNGQLLVLDVWMRSPDAAVPANKLPSARIQFQGDRFYNGAVQQPGNSQGRAAYLEWAADNQMRRTAGGAENPSLLQLSQTSRRYTLAMEPQLVSGETELEGLAMMMMLAFDCFPDFDENGTPDLGHDGDQNGTFIVDRVVATTYTLPPDWGTAAAGACASP